MKSVHIHVYIYITFKIIWLSATKPQVYLSVESTEFAASVFQEPGLRMFARALNHSGLQSFLTTGMIEDSQAKTALKETNTQTPSQQSAPKKNK